MTAKKEKKDTRFKPGQSGNPSGRPLGSRNTVSLACEELLDGDAEKITRKAISLALGGDTVALRLCMERLCPPRKERPISLSLPKIDGAADVTKALESTIAAVAAGELTPGEGTAIASLLETKRKAIETEDHERRLEALERERDNAR